MPNYAIKGKLSDGQNVTGEVNGNDASDALAKVHANLPEGTSIVSVTVKRKGAAGTLKFGAPRAKKASAAAAPAAPVTPAVEVPAPRKR